MSVEGSSAVGLNRQVELGAAARAAGILLQQLGEAVRSPGIFELRERQEPSPTPAEHIAQRLDASLNGPLLAESAEHVAESQGSTSERYSPVCSSME